MNKSFELLPPSMPNFISIKQPARPKQEGLVELPKIPVGDLTEEEAQEYAELMKQTFLDHWKTRKTQ